MITKLADSSRALNATATGPQAKSSPDDKLREVAALYEKHFLGEIVKAMRTTVPDGGFIKTNQAEKIFREKLDQEYVEHWGDRGGIGLQDLIYDQLIEKYGVQMGLKVPDSKPRGPLPLNEKSNFSGRLSPLPQSGGITARFEKLSNPSEEIISQKSLTFLQAPWSGNLLNKISLDETENLIEIDHGDRLKSQFVYRGPPSYLQRGSQILPGQNIAALSPDSKGFFWNLINKK